MLEVMSCWLGSVVVALPVGASECLFFLCIHLGDQELFLATEAANGGTRSDWVSRFPA